MSRALAVVGWIAFLVTADNLIAVRSEAEMHARNYRQCVTRGAALIEHAASDYTAWRRSLAPLYETRHPVEMEPVATDGGMD